MLCCSLQCTKYIRTVAVVGDVKLKETVVEGKNKENALVYKCPYNTTTWINEYIWYILTTACLRSGPLQFVSLSERLRTTDGARGEQHYYMH